MTRNALTLTKLTLACLPCLLLLCLVALPSPSRAQGYFGTVSGTLADPTGAVIPGAKVTLTDQDKGYAFSTTSDPVGRYLFRSIPPGVYSVTATVTGFSSPRGNVLFTAGGKLLCKVALGATGKATCSWTPTGTQKVTLVATYTGDNDYAGSWGTLDLTPAFGYDPNVTMNFNSTTLTYPGATNVTICVARATSVAATGVVEILDNGNMLTALTLGGDGCAYWYINPGLDAGHHHLQAFYFGDSHNLGGYSTIADVTVNPVTTQMEVSCWNSSFPVGGDYTCQVSTWSNAGSPPGNINYSYDGGPVHHASLSNGNTLFVISHPAVGHHTVAIAYPGTQNYSATPINTQYFTVTP